MLFELKFKVKTNTCGHFCSRWPAGVPSKNTHPRPPWVFLSGFSRVFGPLSQGSGKPLSQGRACQAQVTSWKRFDWLVSDPASKGAGIARLQAGFHATPSSWYNLILKSQVAKLVRRGLSLCWGPHSQTPISKNGREGWVLTEYSIDQILYTNNLLCSSKFVLSMK